MNIRFFVLIILRHASTQRRRLAWRRRAAWGQLHLPSIINSALWCSSAVRYILKSIGGIRLDRNGFRCPVLFCGGFAVFCSGRLLSVEESVFFILVSWPAFDQTVTALYLRCSSPGMLRQTVIFFSKRSTAVFSHGWLWFIFRVAVSGYGAGAAGMHHGSLQRAEGTTNTVQAVVQRRRWVS